MTKKAMGIIVKFEDKIKNAMYFYKNNLLTDIYNDTTMYTKLREIYNEFRDMISGMYKYDLISEKDWKAISDKGFEIYCKYDDERIDFYCNK